MDDLQDLLEFQEIEDLYQEGIINIQEEHHIVQYRHENYNKWNDEEFYQQFRFSKHTVRDIFLLIGDRIRHRTERNDAISPLDQILLFLRFYATGSFHITCADFVGVHRTTAGQIIKRVTNAIVDFRQQFITMPETDDDINTVKQEFFAMQRFPRVLGVIDCTHIKIQSPGGDQAEIFRNRKGFFSYNVQVVGDAKNKILDIVVNHPGSSHDSHIFDDSRIRMRFENGEMGNSVLLGDSGYPCRPYIMTPIPNPLTPAEQLFNDSLIKTRITIERTFGIWKRRFPILSLEIRSHFPLVLDIIMACAVLHNIAQSRNEPDFIEDEERDYNENNDNFDNNIQYNNNREQFINYFQTLL